MFNLKSVYHFFRDPESLVKSEKKSLQNNVFSKIRELELTQCTLTSREMGVTDSELCDEHLVVSLTSYGKRIYKSFLAIESIMQGTVKPNKIVLWLPDSMKNQHLPKTLLNQVSRGLQIEFCEDILSYKKLIPSLKKYPESSIITIDDDLMYDFDCVENLVASHIKNPKEICAARVKEIAFDESCKMRSYIDWRFNRNVNDVSVLNFFTSGGGTLFPPRIFDDEIFNQGVFLDICKSADDVWFNAMALRQGVSIRKIFTKDLMGNDFISILDTQEISLNSINNHSKKNCRNDIQIKAVFDKYDLWPILKKAIR